MGKVKQLYQECRSAFLAIQRFLSNVEIYRKTNFNYHTIGWELFKTGTCKDGIFHKEGIFLDYNVRNSK